MSDYDMKLADDYAEECDMKLADFDAETSKRSTIPYSIKDPTSHVICYENDKSQPVRMGDTVSITVFGYETSEFDVTGELMEVSYGLDGFIDSVRLYSHKTDYLSTPISCEGVIYRPEAVPQCG